MDTDFLDWALADFSGYVAADELYDGPFCILSAVDNRRYKRILYDVLDHDPTHDDIRAFLQRLQTALAVRDLTLRGMTTDGSPLYPTPLAEVFRGVPHQLCQFHVVKDIVKAVVQAVARERKRLAAQQPTIAPGPSEHPGGPAGGPHEKAAGSATRRLVRLTISVRPASPEQNRTQDPLARQPWLAPVMRAPGRHGPSVCAIRSALSDPDRSGQTRPHCGVGSSGSPRWGRP